MRNVPLIRFTNTFALFWLNCSMLSCSSEKIQSSQDPTAASTATPSATTTNGTANNGTANNGTGTSETTKIVSPGAVAGTTPPNASLRVKAAQELGEALQTTFGRGKDCAVANTKAFGSEPGTKWADLLGKGGTFYTPYVTALNKCAYEVAKSCGDEITAGQVKDSLCACSTPETAVAMLKRAYPKFDFTKPISADIISNTVISCNQGRTLNIVMGIAMAFPFIIADAENAAAAENLQLKGSTELYENMASIFGDKMTCFYEANPDPTKPCARGKCLAGHTFWMREANMPFGELVSTNSNFSINQLVNYHASISTCAEQISQNCQQAITTQAPNSLCSCNTPESALAMLQRAYPKQAITAATHASLIASVVSDCKIGGNQLIGLTNILMSFPFVVK